MKAAFVGCGNIADRYAASIAATGRFELAGATDVEGERAEALVARWGGTAYPTLDALLADDAVEVVVNLTPPQLHAPVTAAALEAGKHVHSEKPLALTHPEAQELVELAGRRGRQVRLRAVDAARRGAVDGMEARARGRRRPGPRGLRRGELGEDRVLASHPEALYAVGPLVDVGVYPLTIVTGIFGPARRVVAYSTTVEPERVTLAGAPFRPGAADFVVAVLELSEGVVVRVTASFYVPPSKQGGLELHGDAGSLFLASWSEFDSRVELAPPAVASTRPCRRCGPFPGTDWGRGCRPRRRDRGGGGRTGRAPSTPRTSSRS